MDGLDDATRRRVEDRLRQDQFAWLATTRDGGQPDVVPVWFFWDGEWILIYTKPDSRKVRSLRDTRRATLHLERPHTLHVVIVEGEAELLAEPSAAVVSDGYLEACAAGMAALGLPADAMTAEDP